MAKAEIMARPLPHGEAIKFVNPIHGQKSPFAVEAKTKSKLSPLTNLKNNLQDPRIKIKEVISHYNQFERKWPLPPIEKRNTAQHENGHVIVLLKHKKASLKRVSTIPGDGYLGITEFGGYLSPESIALINAGSMIDTVGAGEASGLSGDLNTIDILQRHYGVKRSLKDLKKDASKIVTSYPEGFREKLGIITANMGELNHRDFLWAMREAKEWYETEMKLKDPSFKNLEIDLLDQVEMEEEELKVSTRFIYTKERIFVEYIGGEKDGQSTSFLRCCGGINGHLPGCEVLKRISKDIKNNPIESKKVIFDRNNPYHIKEIPVKYEEQKDKNVIFINPFKPSDIDRGGLTEVSRN